MISLYKGGQINIVIPVGSPCLTDGDISITLIREEDRETISFNPNTSFGVAFNTFTFYESATQDLDMATVTLGDVDTEYSIEIYYLPPSAEPILISTQVGIVKPGL